MTGSESRQFAAAASASASPVSAVRAAAPSPRIRSQLEPGRAARQLATSRQGSGIMEPAGSRGLGHQVCFSLDCDAAVAM